MQFEVTKMSLNLDNDGRSGNMKNFKSSYGLILMGLLFAASTVFAQVPDQSTPPDAVIKMVVTDVMASVKADPDIQKGNIPKIV